MGKRIDELIKTGYTWDDVDWTKVDFVRRSWQKGYVSRRRPDKNVYQSGGYRKGEYYILETSDASTRYCVRAYINLALKEARNADR